MARRRSNPRKRRGATTTAVTAAERRSPRRKVKRGGERKERHPREEKRAKTEAEVTRVRRRSYELRLKDTFLVLQVEHDASVCRSRRLIKRLTSNVTVNREYRARAYTLADRPILYLPCAPFEQSVSLHLVLARRDNDKRNKSFEKVS